MEDSSDSEEYTFSLDRTPEREITLKIGEVTVPFLIDSGATCNIINSEILNKLDQKIVREITADKKLFAYGSQKPLQIKRKINVEIMCEE